MVLAVRQAHAPKHHPGAFRHRNILQNLLWMISSCQKNLLEEYVMPQPLSRVTPGGMTAFGNSNDSPSNHRPELSLLAMSVIAEWAILDSWVSNLFIKL